MSQACWSAPTVVSPTRRDDPIARRFELLFRTNSYYKYRVSPGHELHGRSSVYFILFYVYRGGGGGDRQKTIASPAPHSTKTTIQTTILAA